MTPPKTIQVGPLEYRMTVRRMEDYGETDYLHQQIDIATRVLASQGWGAWPGCSAMLGLR
jgi:hypothetical protein